MEEELETMRNGDNGKLVAITTNNMPVAKERKRQRKRMRPKISLKSNKMIRKQKIDEEERGNSPPVHSISASRGVSKRKRRHAFPEKLYNLLESSTKNGQNHIIDWVKNGKAFRVKEVNVFENELLPKSFGHKKMRSFTRQLSYWGFQRVGNSKNSENEFMHPKFIRGEKSMTSKILRTKRNDVGVKKSGAFFNFHHTQYQQEELVSTINNSEMFCMKDMVTKNASMEIDGGKSLKTTKAFNDHLIQCHTNAFDLAKSSTAVELVANNFSNNNSVSLETDNDKTVFKKMLEDQISTTQARNECKGRRVNSQASSSSTAFPSSSASGTVPPNKEKHQQKKEMGNAESSSPSGNKNNHRRREKTDISVDNNANICSHKESTKNGNFINHSKHENVQGLSTTSIAGSAKINSKMTELEDQRPSHGTVPFGGRYFYDVHDQFHEDQLVLRGNKYEKTPSWNFWYPSNCGSKQDITSSTFIFTSNTPELLRGMQANEQLPPMTKKEGTFSTSPLANSIESNTNITKAQLVCLDEELPISCADSQLHEHADSPGEGEDQSVKETQKLSHENRSNLLQFPLSQTCHKMSGQRGWKGGTDNVAPHHRFGGQFVPVDEDEASVFSLLLAEGDDHSQL